MRFKYAIFLLVTLQFISCNYFSEKKENKRVLIDTIIDYSKVDISPAFIGCKKLPVNKKEKCFNAELKKRITGVLRNYNFTTKELINETILLNILIDNKGVFQLKNIQSSKKIAEQLPQFDSIVKTAIKKLPIITPAVKRGIPVTTQYKLPIKIRVEEEVN